MEMSKYRQIPTDTEEEIPFEALKETTALPHAPHGKRVKRVRFTNCPGKNLYIECIREMKRADKKEGVPEDAWWVVRCDDLPDRTLRLFQGGHSLLSLLRRYGFQDATGCVNHKKMTIQYVPTGTAYALCDIKVPAHLLESKGVPQFYLRSGVCWFATLCWTSFANKELAAFLKRFMPREIHEAVDQCLFDRDQAEALRKFLWYKFSVGDNVEDRPENDGKNGFREFMVLCAKLEVPLVVYRERSGTLHPVAVDVRDQRGDQLRMTRPASFKEAHLLVLRFTGADHDKNFPVHRRISIGPRRYRLIGVYMGQSKCGHQIGLCCPTGHWRDWALGDADCHKDGIGPIFITFDEDRWKDNWWEPWRTLVHVTKYGPRGDKFCPFSPLNVSDDALDIYQGPRVVTKGPGSNNLDLVYKLC